MKQHITEETIIFFSVMKWLFLSTSVGIIIGYLMSVFLKTLKYAE
jgi:hypothetical protein